MAKKIKPKVLGHGDGTNVPNSMAKLDALIGEVGKLEEMLTRLIMLIDPAARRNQPTRQQFISGQWHRRSGTVYGKVALPGSPNAQEDASATAPKAAPYSDNPTGHL